jgi:hypothetical protein
LAVVQGDFDLRALYDAMDEQRLARQMSWGAVAEQVNRLRTSRRPIAASTITALKQRPVGEGDGILQMLLWLRRTPESFVPGIMDPGSEIFCRPQLSTTEILRWDTQALFAALDEQRRTRQLTWTTVAREVGGFTSNMLTHLSKGGRVGFPHVMRLVRWLGQPAAVFIRVANW